MSPRRTLVVTNDFPPRPGGIQSYVYALASRQPSDSVVVYAPAWDRATGFDEQAPFPVVRHPTSLMLPTPDVAARAARIAAAEGCNAVWYGAAAPLGLLTPWLRAHAGIERAVASTHGHEVGWALVPGGRQALRRIGTANDVVTYLGAYTRARLAPALGLRSRMAQLPSGVDPDVFYPGAGGQQVRARLGLADRPVVVCVSRLVERKGQDKLIQVLPALRRRVPDTALLIVGGGPYRASLERLARDVGVADQVVITGSVPWAELPAYYDAGTVFAMPARSRRRGLEVEGLGIVYLEASATGLPVVAGDSGGAPDAVLAGKTGHVIDGNDLQALTDAVGALLADPAGAARMGAAGREWVTTQWRWQTIADRLTGLLAADGSVPVELP